MNNILGTYLVFELFYRVFQKLLPHFRAKFLSTWEHESFEIYALAHLIKAIFGCHNFAFLQDVYVTGPLRDQGICKNPRVFANALTSQGVYKHASALTNALGRLQTP